MKKFLIFLAIGVVTVFATIDASQRMQELDRMAIKTPAQVEIKDDLIKREPQQNETQRPRENNIQTPANSFNERLREQQNNNIPQTKQPNLLKN